MTQLLIADSTDPNMLYATGLHMSDPFIWVRMGEGKRTRDYVLVNGLEYSRVKDEASAKVILIDKIDLKDIRKPVGRNRNLADIAAAFLLSYNVREVIAPENCWAIHLETLREHGLKVKLIAPFFPERIQKTEAEIAKIKRAGLVTKKAFKRAHDILKESKIDWNNTLIFEGKRLTSEFIKFEIEKIFLANGCASGESIVACAEQASQPHNRGSGLLYAGEPIVIDLFPRDLKSGYYFDMTRTIIKGTPGKELLAMYHAVHRAQLAGLAAVKAGVKASDVHAACQKVFVKAGYKTTETEGFIHSTGHGLGLGLHEMPSVSPRNIAILEANMVITIEPGLYYKELGGVRIEDTVVVGKKGCINLTNLPKILILK
jgi:Xaa-Pro aminopeptidase